jgi:hypothetical protein
LKNSNASLNDRVLALRQALKSSPRCSDLLMDVLQGQAEAYQLEAARANEIRDVRRAQGAHQAIMSLMKKVQAEANTAP